MATSSLNTHWCAPPIINHLHCQKEALHIILILSTPFLEMGQGCQNAPVELELQFQNSIPLVSLRMDHSGDLTYIAGGIRGQSGVSQTKLPKVPANEASRDPLRWSVAQ